jgi:hypothetical protein
MNKEAEQEPWVAHQAVTPVYNHMHTHGHKEGTKAAAKFDISSCFLNKKHFIIHINLNLHLTRFFFLKV